MDLKGLVLAAGEGSRLRPFTFSRPKHLIPLLGKPMIQYAIDDLVDSGVKDIGVVVGYFKDLIKDALGEGSNNYRLSYIVQEKRLGIAHAIYLSIEEGFLDKPFIVYLGDNILSRGVRQNVRRFLEKDADVYILLSKVKDPSRFGVAVLRDGRVVRLVEKPREFVSDLAVVGVYMFRDPDLVVKAFKTLKPSWRGEYEITELIQWFIDNNYQVEYDVITGWWKDVGTYNGLLEALYLLLDNVNERFEGDIRGEVIGRAIVEKEAVVEGRVYGPAYIGRNVVVEKDTSIEHYTSIEQGAKILSGSLSRSLVLEEASLDIGVLRLRDSIIGARSIVKSRRGNHGEARLVISDNSIVEF
ncbi:glucose-1-phosphate thymidylyltransferase [Thermosphaera aggregans]|uniref:Glucose-1-phosphate thymidyltransferase n=1 Tax=Thermosphaera aggregans (strain DSM 11486 / M11TL) TaxID=633148 RepID=D5U137_THEAM|nr:glucose-1-phosphate thymidylyltransferase [Thermosphaera aggregans]ADG90837.1 glucose-1-phosphate thymidyltransferase [Thermosphaera aggregans DSM 11486]